MKKLSFFLVALLCSMFTNAQIVFQSNFQTEEEYQQWTVIDNNEDAVTWSFDPYAEPSKVFYSYHETNPADDWIISPAITSTETGVLSVNFTVKGSNYGEKIEVFYGTQPSLDAMTNRITDVIDLGGELSSHLYLINANANEPLYLGFHACINADCYRMYLCEVKVQFATNPVDIQVAKFVSPVSDSDLDQETVTVKVKNSGNVDVESFDVSFSIDDVTVATETINAALAVGTEMEYTFDAKADLSSPRKLYTLKAWTSHPDDVNTTNDACVTSVLHKAPATVPYAMGFEADEYTDGITFFNLNEDDGDWSLYTDPWWSLAHTGDYCLAYNYDKNNNGDDWAILEPITVEEAGYYVLRFWYSGDDNHPEKLAVYYGNEGTPEGMTNKIVEYAPFARDAYEESVNVVYIAEPQTINIGFYAFSDKDENWMCVDDVTFEKIKDEDMEVAVLPITNPLEYVHKGTKKDIEFKVRNLGVQDVTSTINVKIDEETIYEETVEIAGQELKDVVIEDALADLSAGVHDISVVLTTASDISESNNTQSLSIYVMDEPVMSWDFEDGNLPADFTFRVEDEGTVNPNAGNEFNEEGWGVFNIQVHELYGGCVMAGTTWLDGTDQADRWCILPPVTASEESYLVWDAASFNPNYLETYSIMISTNGDDSWYYFTEEEYVSESADFNTRGISLSEYDGQDIYIAFRLRSENCEHLILDNIELYGVTAVEAVKIQAPTNVTAVAISHTEVELSWDPVEGAIYYGIYVNGMWKGSVMETTAVVDGLSPDIEYCFTIISISEVDENNNMIGYSDHSEPACATTFADGVEEHSVEINIYPNPVNDMLFIENGSDIEEISIYTVTGVMVYNEECAGGRAAVNVSELQGGVYILKIRTENSELINRFVKK